MKSHYKFLWMALLSILFLGACSSGADDILELDTDKLTISTPNLTAEAKGGIGAITFTTNKSWTATSDQNWCKLDKSYGNASNITINFTLEANPTTKERTAKITINAGTASATATVKQAKREEDKITLNESNFTAKADGEAITIKFTTNQTWSVSSDKSWCMSGWKMQGQAGTINLQVTIDANPTTEERTAKITINAGTASATATVKQAKREDKITLFESNFTAEADGKTLTIPFTTNRSWTVTSDKNWCSLNMTSGQVGNINLQVTIESNPTTEERTAKITINAGTANATATVKQAKREEDKITLNESNFTAEANGKTLTIPFTTNKSWTVTSDKNWCSLNMTSGQAGTINLQVTIEANPTTEERTAKITINADTASATVTVKQAKKENGGESGNGNSIDDMQNQKW